MRACWNGNRELALKLYNKNHLVLKKVNEKGQNCLEVAKTAGHPDIATVLECLEAARILDSKNDSFLTITPQNDEDDECFAKPYGISSIKKFRTKSLDDHRNQSPSGLGANRSRIKLRSPSPFYSSEASSPVHPLTISIEPAIPSKSILSSTRKQLFKRASFDLSLTTKINKDLQRSMK